MAFFDRYARTGLDGYTHSWETAKSTHIGTAVLSMSITNQVLQVQGCAWHTCHKFASAKMGDDCNYDVFLVAAVLLAAP
jgi:hypothetical protein